MSRHPLLIPGVLAGLFTFACSGAAVVPPAPVADVAAPVPAAAAAVPEKPPEPPPLNLRVVVGVGMGPARRLLVHNDNTFDWTGCVIKMDETWSYTMDVPIFHGEDDGIMMGKFHNADGKAFKESGQIDWVRVTCDQGKAKVRPN